MTSKIEPTLRWEASGEQATLLSISKRYKQSWTLFRSSDTGLKLPWWWADQTVTMYVYNIFFQLASDKQEYPSNKQTPNICFSWLSSPCSMYGVNLAHWKFQLVFSRPLHKDLTPTHPVTATAQTVFLLMPLPRCQIFQSAVPQGTSPLVCVDCRRSSPLHDAALCHSGCHIRHPLYRSAWSNYLRKDKNSGTGVQGKQRQQWAEWESGISHQNWL